MTNHPLTYIHGNLLFGADGTTAALYRVDTVSYPFLSTETKRDWLGRLARFAFDIENNFSVWRVCRQVSVDQYVDEAAELLDPRAAAGNWAKFIDGHRQRLETMAAFVPETYLAITLPPPRHRVNDMRAAAGMLRAHVRRRGAPVTRTEIDRLIDAELAARQRADATLPIHPATTREIQWLLRRAGCRGVCEPMIDPYWAPSAVEVDGGRFEPLETDLWRLSNAPLEEQDRCLVVDSEEARTYQAMLTLGALPETCDFPGNAEFLCTPLEALPFPVDAVMHVRWVANRDAAKQVRKRVVDADNAFIDQLRSEHGPLSYTVEENRLLARELDAYLAAAENPPLLYATIGFAVGAPDRTELDHRVEALRNRFNPILYRPLGLQKQLFLDHLPRTDGGRTWDYKDVLTVEQFGALMPHGTHEVGSRRGAYFAHVAGGGHRPVLNDITEAPREGHAPSILLFGSLGSGKTVTAQWLAYQALLRGSLGVDVDPKPDHNLEGVAGLGGRVHVIELVADKRFRGMLDPLRVAPPGIREDLAHSYLMDLLPSSPPAWETHVLRAIKEVLGTQRPSCTAVLNRLRASAEPEARRVAEALEVWADSGIARLGFGDDTTPDAHRDALLTTIKASGLSLPEPDVPRADYDRNERIAVATMKLVTGYAMRLVMGDRSRHKVILIDEAWVLLESRDGRRLLDRLNRTGRTENATLILVTQRLTEVGDIEALVGTRMVFRQETEADARQALALLGLDPGDRRMVERLRSYPTGRNRPRLCLMRDVHGRIGEIQIDVVPPDLLDTWDTTPGMQTRLDEAA
jgi:hypothetical protein